MKTVLVRLNALQEKARQRPPGYIEDYISRSNIEGDKLRLPLSEHQAMLRKYRPGSSDSSPLTARRSHPKGLGDLIHAFAHPVARVADAVLGTNLRQCPACSRRRASLNRHFPLF